MTEEARLRVGEKILWRHCPSGGYGYTFLIPGKVVGFGRGRVKIEVKKADGTPVVRHVKEESLIQEA